MWARVLSISIISLGHLESLKLDRAMLSLRVIFLTSNPRLMWQNLKDQLNYRKVLHNINVFCPLVNMCRDIHILIRAMTEIHFQILDVLTVAIKVIQMMGFVSLLLFYKTWQSFHTLQIFQHHIDSMH